MSGLIFERPEGAIDVVNGADGDTKRYKGACNLGSVFLPAFLREKTENDETYYTLDWEALSQSVKTGVRMLDNVIDINRYPHPDFESYQKNMRTIGLGLTGLGDVMALMGLRYGSEQSELFASALTNFIAANAYMTSAELAMAKGAFPFFDKKKFLKSGYLQRRHKILDRDQERYSALEPSEETTALITALSLDSNDSDRNLLTWNNELWETALYHIDRYGIRNARLLSVAPTGTLSMVFGGNCSSGLEPIYKLEMKRNVHITGQRDEDIETIVLRDPAWEEYCEGIKAGKKYRYDLKNAFVAVDDTTATDDPIPVQSHVRILGAVAANIDMSCSKTINIPSDYSFEDTKQVYMECWKRGIKGCTIFRPNEFREGIFVTDDQEEEGHATPSETASMASQSALKRGEVIRVDDNVLGLERHLKTGCGTLHLQAYFDPDTGALLETYCSKGSTGGCNSFMTGMSRLTSLAARGGIEATEIIDQLLSAPACLSYCNKDKETSKGTSCPSAIGYALRDMCEQMQTALGIADKMESVLEARQAKPKDKPIAEMAKCPECGETLTFEGGCNVCKSCGWSKCG